LGWILLASVCLGMVVSGISPKDRFTWGLEVFPVWIGLALILATRRRFPLTRLLLVWLTLHAFVLMIGGHYTYAEVPAGAWFQHQMGWARNPYDRLGHLMQGFVPALLAREVLLRTSPLRPGKWLAFLCVCIPLAFSAFYEILEWQTAVWTGEAAESFLGTQGDVWDTQWDMALAGLGACAAIVCLSRIHNAQLQGA